MTLAPLRIAMWSGPRNISTAMMRAWENRSDTMVIDEPFYAHYLHATGVDHPGRDAVIVAGETDWRRVVDQLTGPVPGGKPIYFQKHMTHHMLPDMALDWLDHCTNVFLIRDPRQVIASYVKRRAAVTLEDIGLARQRELFDHVRRRADRTPPVIDAGRVLADPAGMLRRLCAVLAVDFDERMLSWPAGPRPTDGIWAAHWYHAVERSTGFVQPEAAEVELPPELEALVDRCRPVYEELLALHLV